MPLRVLVIALVAAVTFAQPTVAIAQPSSLEQWVLYELNRARWDPYGYRAETGIAIPETALPQPPLAVETRLSAAARDKAQQLQACGCFSHIVNGTWPNRLAKIDHGYPLPSSWSLDANYIESIYGGTTPLSGLLPMSHHVHLLGQADFYSQHREVGVGRSSNGQRWAIHTAFRHSTSQRLFITGVVYADGNDNGRMDHGEGRSGVTVSIPGGPSTTTNAGGGYSLPVSKGEVTVTAQGHPQVTVTVGEHNVGIDFVTGRSPIVRQYADSPRHAGPDRYHTAVAVSQDAFPDPSKVQVVFVATGEDFPDALAAAAVAGGLGAPLLLTAPSILPAVTRSEIQRLGPSEIVILGGRSAVSSGVAADLAAFGSVTRLDGDDRYETAAAVSQYGFPSPAAAKVVFVATGDGFADALAAAPVAARLGGPVLLTSSSFLPTATRTELLRLSPDEVIILGGSAAISSSVAAEIDSLLPAKVTRIAGANRYATAAAVTQRGFPNSQTPVSAMYMAIGTDFPDALAGSAAAAALGMPILLTPPDRVNSATAAEVARLGPRTVHVLGGTAAFSLGLQQAHLNLLD